jgi:serine/threonine protein kinase
MSPEQVRGEPADHRSDIFAFGCVLYEMLFGRRAFSASSAVGVMNAILQSEPPNLESTTPIHRILQRCLEKRPENRFQSAADLAFALEGLVTSSADSSSRDSLALPRSVATRLLPWAAAVTLGVALLVVMLRSSRSDKD